MITFKQFIAEINLDDRHTTKSAASAAIKLSKLDGYEPLPKVSIPGYDLVWKEDGPNSYRLALTKNSKAVIMMDLKKHQIKVPGGSVTGLATEGIFSDAEFRGKGLAFSMYEGLIKNGQALFSSLHQTTGSKKIWEQLAAAEHLASFVVASGAEARWYLRKHPEYEHQDAHTILLTGPYDLVSDEAYGARDNRWLILPSTFPNVHKLQENALDLSRERTEESKYVPEWEKPCWIVALHKTTGASEEKIKDLAKKKFGWNGTDTGLTISKTFDLATALLGRKPSLEQTVDAEGKTAKEFKGKGTGLVFVHGHVMPMVNGQTSNFNGWGEDEVVAVATWDKALQENKSIVELNADELRREAEAAGHKLFDSHRSGLIFDGDIEIMAQKKYGSTYDTFAYLFRPVKDVADDEVDVKHAIDGVIYVAGADGIKLLTLPGVKIKITGELKLKKDEGDGATWIAVDKNGYEYKIGPRRGQPALSSDAVEALKQIQTDDRFHVANVVKVKKP